MRIYDHLMTIVLVADRPRPRLVGKAGIFMRIQTIIINRLPWRFVKSQMNTLNILHNEPLQLLHLLKIIIPYIHTFKRARR